MVLQIMAVNIVMSHSATFISIVSLFVLTMM